MSPSQKVARAGIVCLDPLYKLVGDNATDRANAYSLKTKSGKEYSSRCKELTSSIPDCQGVYVWGRYDSRRYWHNIYFGMAGFSEGKKSLRKRILEELKDERAFIWHHYLTRNEIQRIRQSVLHERGHERDPYQKVIQRALRKLGALNVIWMRFEGPADVRGLESDMIEALNPRANLERPAPKDNVQHESGKLFERFRAIVHHHRPQHASALQHSMDHVNHSAGPHELGSSLSMAEDFVRGLNSEVLRNA